MVEEEKHGVRVVDKEEQEAMRKGGEVSGGKEAPGKEVVAGDEERKVEEKVAAAAAGGQAETGGREVRSRPKSRYVSYDVTGGSNGVNLSSSVDGGKGGGGCQWRSSRENRRELARYR